MIYIALPFPVILRSQLSNIAYNLGQSEEDISAVQCYTKYIDCPEGTIKFLDESEWIELRDSNPDKNLDWTDRMGSPGLLGAALKSSKRAYKLESVRCIYIPGYIWHSFRARARNDLTYLLNRLENRINRLQKLEDIGAPDIIIRNERRLVEECVWAIDDNKYGHRVRNDKDEPCISLQDVNYSIGNYTWLDDRDKDADPKLIYINPPGYFTRNDVKNLKELMSLADDMVKSRDSTIEKLRSEIINLKSAVKAEKERYKALQEERNQTVLKLSKDNLVLDHRIDELIQRINSIRTER